jgi:hypothetical protein
LGGGLARDRPNRYRRIRVPVLMSSLSATGSSSSRLALCDLAFSHVVRGMVADYDFDVRVRLGETRVDASDQEVRTVAGGQANRAPGFCGHAFTPLLTEYEEGRMANAIPLP